MTEKKLIDEQLKQVSGGEKIGEDDHFDEVTKLLKEAGDRAWALLGNEVGGLWNYINAAEKARSAIARKDNIQKAFRCLELSFIGGDDYHFIKDRLDKSNELTQ